MTDQPGHVDDFIDDFKQDPYARWVLHHYRLPANLSCDFRRFMAPHKLFCTFSGERYQVRFASRFGHIALERNVGSIRETTLADPYECSDWGAEA